MDSMSSRYALALYDISLEKDKLPLVLDNAKLVRLLIKEHKEILSYFSSRFVEFSEKEKFIDETFINIDEDLKIFIKVIIKNHRSNYIDNIFDEFISMGNEKMNILEGNLVSTYELDASKIKEIEDIFSKKLNQKVELKNVIDESLIGGVRVVLNDHVYDGSVKSRLNSLKNNLKERRAS